MTGEIGFGLMVFIVVGSLVLGWTLGHRSAYNFYKPLLNGLHDLLSKKPGWLLRQRDVDLIREVATDHADLMHIEDLIELSDRMTKMIPPERP